MTSTTSASSTTSSGLPQRLRFLAPGKALNANSSRREHWSNRSELTRLWRQATLVYCRQQRLKPMAGRVLIQVTIGFTDGRRRDVGNWYPTAKAIVDGIVDAKVLPDDSDEYVVGPHLLRGDMSTGPVPQIQVDLVPLD